MEQKFKTKTGFCHVFPDKIVLTRNGIVGEIAKVTTANSMVFSYIKYVVIIIIISYLAYKYFNQGNSFLVGLLIPVIAYIGYGLYKNRNLSAQSTIDINKIRNIEFNQAKKGLTRSYFKIDYEGDDRKFKSRLIMLPGSLSNGTKETERALVIMRNAGLLM